MPPEETVTEQTEPQEEAAAKEELREVHLNYTGMSGRVVRFRVLDQDKIDECEDNGARAAGEDADDRKIRREQLKLLLATMVHSYSEPNQAPEKAPVVRDGKIVKDADGQPLLSIVPARADQAKLKGVPFKLAKAGVLAIHWNSLFNPKESAALRQIFIEHHEMNILEVQMLLGKSRAASTAG